MYSILTVDDSASMRQMVAFTLKGAGFQVLEAVDGVEGLAVVREKKIDLVLIDHNMPRMDGLSMLKELRGMPEYVQIPVLMLTTESSPEMKAAGRAAGATGWLVKPFNPVRLIEVCKKVIR